jgi:hypothetical protein
MCNSLILLKYGFEIVINYNVELGTLGFYEKRVLRNYKKDWTSCEIKPYWQRNAEQLFKDFEVISDDYEKTLKEKFRFSPIYFLVKKNERIRLYNNNIYKGDDLYSENLEKFTKELYREIGKEINKKIYEKELKEKELKELKEKYEYNREFIESYIEL